MFSIAGIQQVGIGNPNVHEAFKWYRTVFGNDIPVFEEAAEANQMLPYTGGQPHQRHAILAINMKGGGGFEIWQYTSRTPEAANFKIQLGDMGFFGCKIKTDNIQAAYEHCKAKGVKSISSIATQPDGRKHFFVHDLYGNIFQVVEFNNYFGKGLTPMGGPSGMIIGVTDIEKSKKFYAEVLGYDTVVYDKTDAFEDLAFVEGGKNKCRRVLLSHSKARIGAFSKLLGASEIELIQTTEYNGKKIFENRLWGDLGFIHLCFDISNMPALKAQCAMLGAPFTVESNPDFDMGEAAGQFAYTEDPDGALIEFVETHKIPILKKLGWYLDLRKRDRSKPLPNWMLKAMALNRVKN